MKRVTRLLVLCAFALSATGAAFAAAAGAPEGKLTLDKPAAIFPPKKLGADGAKTRNPVTFNHKQHGSEFGCKECHHTQPQLKAGEAATPCFGGQCHGPEAVKDAQGRLKPDSWATIHDRQVGKCLKCHGTNEKAVAAKAPTKCALCHGGKE